MEVNLFNLGSVSLEVKILIVFHPYEAAVMWSSLFTVLYDSVFVLRLI